MWDEYMYLFPFEKVEKGSRILIYGAGDVGQHYFKQAEISGYCKVVGFIDRAYDKYSSMAIPVYPPESIKKFQFDYIVIAMKTGTAVKSISEILKRKFGLPKDKIIYIGTRPLVETIQKNSSYSEITKKMAFQKGNISIALKYGPGLGDSIVKKKIVEEIIKLEPNCLIDIYSPGAAEYLKAVYGGNPNINLLIDDGGMLYGENYKNYSASLKVFFMIQVDFFQYTQVLRYNEVLANTLKALEKYCREYKLTPFPIEQNAIHFYRTKLMKKNYYSLYDNIFDIRDQHVEINLNEAWLSSFKNLNLNKYITINYGNGIEKNYIISKQWPREYLNRFTELFAKSYPGIDIIQIGASGAAKIKNVNKYVLGESLELNKYILKNAIFHLDIEGGLVHLATQLATKCIVLFGPTPVHFFGYKQNINIVAKTCKECYCLFEDFNKCARALEKPECMYSLMPELIMEYVDKYIATVNKDTKKTEHVLF